MACEPSARDNSVLTKMNFYQYTIVHMLTADKIFNNFNEYTSCLSFSTPQKTPKLHYNFSIYSNFMLHIMLCFISYVLIALNRVLEPSEYLRNSVENKYD